MKFAAGSLVLATLISFTAAAPVDAQAVSCTLSEGVQSPAADTWYSSWPPASTTRTQALRPSSPT